MKKALIFGLFGLFFCCSAGAQIPPEALFRAVQSGDLEQAVHLLDAGARINETDDRGFSPLSYACAQENLEFLPLLLTYGADFSGQGLAEAPLITAVREGNHKHLLLLLQQGADPKQTDSAGLNGIFLAGRYGKPAMIHLLHAKGVPMVRVSDEGGTTALPFVATYGNAEALATIIDLSGLPPDQTQNSRTPLSFAAEAGNVATCRLLIRRGADPNRIDSKGRTPLHYACAGGHEAVAQVLLEAGASPVIPDANNDFPIHLAVINGMNQTLMTLKSKGADLNAPNVEGKSPLALAAEYGHVQMCRVLVRSGASSAQAKLPELVRAIVQGDQVAVGKARKSAIGVRFAGMYPLSWAILAGENEMARQLLENGADPLAKDANGRQAIHHAAVMNRPDLIDLLVAKGAKVSAKDLAYRQPLHLAVMQRRIDAVRALVQAGADLEARTGAQDDYQLPLHLAIRSGERVLGVILELGAKLESVDGNDNWAVHTAVLAGDAKCLQLLVEKGARVNPVNSAQDSPLHLAAEQGNEDLIRLLLRSGADVNLKNGDGETAAETAYHKFHLRLGSILQ